VGDGSPGSREAEGEGGEGFYIARSGSKFDLPVISRGGADYTYLSKTVAPDFQLFQDCFPTDNGSVPFVVNNSSSLLQFVKDSRAGFEKYGFLDDLHFGEDNLLTLR
jgi:hypothetical protein